jgi:hypothetical protein
MLMNNVFILNNINLGNEIYPQDLKIFYFYDIKYRVKYFYLAIGIPTNVTTY